VAPANRFRRFAISLFALVCAMRFVLLVLASLLLVGPAAAQQPQGSGSNDLNLPSYAAPSSGSEAPSSAGSGRSYGATTRRGGPPEGKGGPSCAEDPNQRRCEACEHTSQLWFCNGNDPSDDVPLGGLEWLAMAGAGYALHRLRRREDEADDEEKGEEALP
jgi:hypothetical protein